MPVIASIYDFEKPYNSAMHPANGAWHREVQCLLKGGCSAATPTLQLNVDRTNINELYLDSATYWSIDKFPGVWYYLKDIVYVTSTVIEVTLEIDPMATFYKPGQKAYVQYASYKYDPMISDARHVIPPANHVKEQSFPLTGFDAAHHGCFIVGWVETSYATGAVTYVMLNSGQLHTLCERIFSDSILDKLKDSIVKLSDMFVSLMWVPLDINYAFGIAPATIDLKAAGETVVQNAKVLPLNYTKGFSIEFKIPHSSTHKKSIDDNTVVNNYSHFVNFAPYTNYCAYLPGVGQIEIDPRIFVDDLYTIGSTITVYGNYTISFPTGDICYDFMSVEGSFGTAQQASGNIGVQLQTPGQNSGVLQSIMSMIGAVGSVAVGTVAASVGAPIMATGAAVSAGTNLISGAVNSVSQNKYVKGSVNGLTAAPFLDNCIITSTTYSDVPSSILNFDYVYNMGGCVFRYDDVDNYLDENDTHVGGGTPLVYGSYLKLSNYFARTNSYRGFIDAFRDFNDLINSARNYDFDGIYIPKDPY